MNMRGALLWIEVGIMSLGFAKTRARLMEFMHYWGLHTGFKEVVCVCVSQTEESAPSAKGPP